MTLVTHQTGPEGKVVQRLLIEQGLTIARELYLGLVIDRAAQRPVLMASPAGGMEIEEVAARRRPSSSSRSTWCRPRACAFQAQKLAFALGLAGSCAHAGRQCWGSSARFKEKDASLIEINPSRRRRPDPARPRREGQLRRQRPRQPPRRRRNAGPHRGGSRVEASKFSLNYIDLDGKIGCMVNGAGLAMATMDIIKLAGGDPAPISSTWRWGE